ncbi:MAG: hypothetical protein PHT69_15435 [Bacteroidales bacterium]|nr:hypothetical protein [Bacteroidales bacterium]
MKLFDILSMFVLLIPIVGISQSVKSVIKVPKQEIEILNGNPKHFRKVNNYLIQFDYSDLKIGGYETEAAYVEYMKEDAELRGRSSDEWEEKWYSNRSFVFEPKFLEIFHKYARTKIKLDTEAKEQNFILKFHTQFVEIGFNHNFQKSPTYINALVTFSDKNHTDEPLVISMKYVVGKEVMSSYSSDFRRIEEAYAKCGKELAKYMRKVIY